jgi:hypothetical protein
MLIGYINLRESLPRESKKVLPNDDYHLIKLIAWRDINKISNGKLGLKSHLFLWVIDLSNTKHRIPDKKA